MGAGDVLDYLERRTPDMLAYLSRLAEQESPSLVPESQHAMKALLAKTFDTLGFRTRLLAGRDRSGGHFYARPANRERGRPIQLLLGHFDTVWPIGTLADMPVQADGNVMRGPGVFDMKWGITQIVFALTAIDALDLPLSVTPVVFLNSDEEIGSRESTRHIRRLARTATRTFVLEPALGPAGALKTTRKGIGRFTITVKGKAAHAGLDPEAGASAILELSFVIQKLFALNDAARGITVNVGTIDGGIMPNVIAPESQAVVDVRIRTQADAERIEREIHALQPSTPGVRLEIDGGIGRPALEATPRNRGLWQLALGLGESIGIELTEASAGGGSDGNTTSQYTATLDGLGAVGDGAHAKHEHFLIDESVRRAALLALLLTAPAQVPAAEPA